MEFYLYENNSYNDVEIKTVYEIEEVLHLSNDKGMLLANWFYRKDGDELKKHFMGNSHYVVCDGDDVWDIIVMLNKVLSEPEGANRDLLALHYFPVVYQIPTYMSSVEMWSEKYYEDLKVIYESLIKVMPNNALVNRERLFFYNIKW